MRNKFAYLCAAGILVLAGCVSVPASRDPRFYGITIIKAQDVKPIELSSDFVIAVSRIKIPEFLNRPHIVTQDKEHKLAFAQFDRWAEPLDEGMTRIIKENIIQFLPRAQVVSYPVDFPVDAVFRVEMEVTRFELDLKGELFFTVQWAVVDIGYPDYTVVKRSEFRLPVENNNYAGAVDAVSAACASLSGQIAKVVADMSEISRPQ